MTVMDLSTKAAPVQMVLYRTATPAQSDVQRLVLEEPTPAPLPAKQEHKAVRPTSGRSVEENKSQKSNVATEKTITVMDKLTNLSRIKAIHVLLGSGSAK
tara:strand:- start:13961 stop:14260 length:300 start_codon:yes stop_codon:yes gene_type:complete